MPNEKLAVRACVFDAYGTLFDLASAAARCSDVLGDKTAAVAALWREKQITYTWLRAAQNLHADFWQVTGDGLDFTLETLGITRLRRTQRLMGLYRQLDHFPEVPTRCAA
jgi:2-haloacid dehalogenase